MRMGRVAIAVCALPALPLSVAAVSGGKAKYIGGTVEIGIKEKSDQSIDFKNQERLTFAGGKLVIPWTSIKDVEYGQKVGHRIGTAILISPVALFKKARHHFVTIDYADSSGHEQATVLEFDKGDIRMALASFRARTGKDITFQDEEARKQMGGGAEPKQAK